MIYKIACEEIIKSENVTYIISKDVISIYQ